MDVLTFPQKDKLILALGDIGRMLYDDPRRYTYDELEEVLTVLAGRGFKFVPLNEPVSATAAPAPAPAPAASAKRADSTALSPGERYTIEATYLASLKQMQGKEGFVYKWHQMKYVLTLLCRTNGIPLPKQ